MLFQSAKMRQIFFGFGKNWKKIKLEKWHDKKIAAKPTNHCEMVVHPKRGLMDFWSKNVLHYVILLFSLGTFFLSRAFACVHTHSLISFEFLCLSAFFVTCANNPNKIVELFAPYYIGTFSIRFFLFLVSSFSVRKCKNSCGIRWIFIYWRWKCHFDC